MDLRVYTDEQLEDLRMQVVGEQDRRRNLAAIPAQVADMARTYREGGGDTALLVQAVTTGPDGQ